MKSQKYNLSILNNLIMKNDRKILPSGKYIVIIVLLIFQIIITVASQSYIKQIKQKFKFSC
jgi:hypothetical protein